MPTNFQARWKSIKAAFIKDAREVPPEISMLLSQGRDFGPALKSFDAAATFDARRKAMPAVLRAKDDYLDEIRDALKHTKAPPGVKALTGLKQDIEGLWREVEQAAQPPRPSGQFVKARVIRGYDLARGLKTECLAVEPILVTIEIEVDKTFQELMDQGKEGAKVDRFGNIAQAEIDKIRDAFHKTIKTVDAGIKKDPGTCAEKTREANEVLQYYGRLVEDQVNAKVQAEWKAFLQRRADIKEFRIKSGTKIVLGTIGVGVAIASVALSFGTAWMNIFAACRGIIDVAKAIKTWGESIDTVYEGLVDDMQKVTKLNAQRAKARDEGKGQKASKAAEFGKELVAAALPFTKNMVKAVSAIEARNKQFNGLLSKLEDGIDDLSGRIEVITRSLTGLPNRLLSTEQINLGRRMDKTIKQLFAELGQLSTKVENGVRFSNAAMKAVKTLKDTDSWLGTTETAGGLANKTAAIYGLANFCYACADAGRQLASLVPV